MMDIQLRDATATDSEFVFDVGRQAIGPYVELAWGWDDAGERERHAERWSRQRYRVVVVAAIDVGYVSTAMYGRDTNRYPAGLYLHQLMLMPAFQSCGIGAVCLGRVQAEARERGLPLHLRVLRVNPRALNFYLAHGCQIVGESASHFFVQWTAARP